MKNPMAPYESSNGLWRVLADNNKAAEDLIDLGLFRGEIDILAYNLAHMTSCRLIFVFIEEATVDDIMPILYMPKYFVRDPKPNNIHVTLSAGSDTWDLGEAEELARMKLMFSGRPVLIEVSNYAHTFILDYERGVGIYYWSRPGLAATAGYPHNSRVEGDYWEIAKDIMDKGLNVMLRSDKSMIYVSDDLFRQR